MLAVGLQKRSRHSTVLIELCAELLIPLRKSAVKLKIVTGIKGTALILNRHMSESALQTLCFKLYNKIGLRLFI